MLILFTSHSAKALKVESFGVPTIFKGSVVDAAISLMIATSVTAVTNNPSAPACWYSFALLIVRSSGESNFCRKPSVRAL